MNATSALRSIAALGGNLPDERLTDRTGPNDAAHRGLMYTEARRLARAALAEIEPSTPAASSNDTSGDRRFSLELTKFSCGPDCDARAEQLKRRLNGLTYMNLEVIAAPHQGELHISISGTAESQEAFNAMVIGVLADELAKALLASATGGLIMNVLSGKTGVLLLDRLRLSNLTGTDLTISRDDAAALLDLVNEVSLCLQREPARSHTSLAASFNWLVHGFM